MIIAIVMTLMYFGWFIYTNIFDPNNAWLVPSLICYLIILGVYEAKSHPYQGGPFG